MTLLQAGTGNWLMQAWPLLAMIGVMYFLFLRPQIKKQKDQVRFVDSLEKGKEVVTNSGMIGRINKIEGNVISLQVDQKTFVRIMKSAISKEMTAALTPEQKTKELEKEAEA